jgi:hypothetical protein
VNRAADFLTKLVEDGLPASPSLDCLELLPPPWCCRDWVLVHSGIGRRPTDHAARIAADYPIKRLAIAIQELEGVAHFAGVLPAALRHASEIAQRALGAFLIEFPSVAHVACAQQVKYLLDARKDCVVIDRFSHG